MSIEIEIELLGTSAVIDIEYKWFGNNRAATLTDPEEFAELELGMITRYVNGVYVDVTSFFDEADMKIIEAEVLLVLAEEF